MNKLKKMFLSLLAKLKTKGFFHIFGSSTINKIIGFASTWVIVRIVSKAEYGVYSYSHNLYSFFLILSGLGVMSAFLQLGSETADKNEKDVLYRYSLKFGVTVNLIVAVIITLVGAFVPMPYENAGFLLVLMAGLPIVVIINELQLTYLRIETRNVEYSRLNTLNSIVIFALSCIFAVLFKSIGLILAAYVAHIISVIVAYKKYGIKLKIGNCSLSKETKKSLLSIASISMLNNGLSRLMYLLDIFVLGQVIIDSSMIASYKIATHIPTAMQFIPQAVMVFLYPYFARNKDNRAWLLRNYKRLVLLFGLFNFAVSAAMFIFAKPIIFVFFGEQYLDALVPFRILSLSYFFSATFRSIAGNLLITQRKLKFNLFISVLACAMNTVLNVIMIQAWHSTGAALATLITVVVSGMISTGYLIYTFLRKEKAQ
ncbi:MAG: oligosaccharide flippase family protein [Clostridia bacterium]|nr:oligosaccharide flippase family protein [Clostridia bacterium]